MNQSLARIIGKMCFLKLGSILCLLRGLYFFVHSSSVSYGSVILFPIAERRTSSGGAITSVNGISIGLIVLIANFRALSTVGHDYLSRYLAADRTLRSLLRHLSP